MARGIAETDTLEVVTSGNWALATTAGNRATIHELPDGVVACLGNPRLNDTVPADFAAQTLEAFKKRGADCLTSINGHFSIAIRDHGRGTTLIAADRAGIQPIYYTQLASGWAFSSSLECLVNHPGVDTTLDRQALYEYLFFHAIASPTSVYRNVKRLDPGEFVELSNDAANTGTYWSLEYSNEARRLQPGAQDVFLSLMRQAVASSIEGSQRPGCFLSGGTDSSTVSGVLTELAGPARTYSIGFDAEGYDEMEYAHIASRHFGTEHHEYYVTPDDVVDVIPKIAASYGQPFGNSSAVPTYYCAKMAKEDGVDLLLGGDGGDELFGGNVNYGTQNLFNYYQKIPAVLRRGILEPFAATSLGGFGPFHKMRRYIEQAIEPMPDRLETYNHLQMFELHEMLEPAFLDEVDVKGPLDRMRRVYDGARTESFINRMLALDYHFVLAGNDLPKVSVMSGAADMEVGYPFLDDRMVEFAAALPTREKVRGMRLRVFFKESLKGFLPQAIIDKKKHGFGLPFGPWVASHARLNEMVRDSLDGLKSRGLIRPEFIDSLMDVKLATHAHYYGGFVWILMMLEQWLRHHDARAARAAKASSDNR